MGSDLTLTPLNGDIIRVKRVFAATPARVWRAMTEPDLVMQWQGMTTHPVLSVEIDLRVGGRWRYVWGSVSGAQLVAHGEYLDLSAPHRMVHTETFEEDWTDGPTTVTTTLTATDVGTQMVMDILYSGKKGQSMALQSGMEHGMLQAYRQLDTLAAGMS
jgi:uncharacterized protein YndB with AHSA1/START domain